MIDVLIAISVIFLICIIINYYNRIYILEVSEYENKISVAIKLVWLLKNTPITECFLQLVHVTIDFDYIILLSPLFSVTHLK